MGIAKYVADHTERGECKCGRCIDVGSAPDPSGPHTVDMIMFKVAAKGEPSADEFRRLTREHQGYYAQLNVFDGAEHGYIELGGWIGDQGMALRYMALGAALGVFDLLTPRTILPAGTLPEEMIMQAAQNGFVTVRARPPAEAQS